jgi:hypothetical protein
MQMINHIINNKVCKDQSTLASSIWLNQESSHCFQVPVSFFCPSIQKSAQSIAELSHETISRKIQRKAAKNKSLFHVEQISFRNVIKGWSLILNGSGRKFLMGLGIQGKDIWMENQR